MKPHAGFGLQERKGHRPEILVVGCCRYWLLVVADIGCCRPKAILRVANYTHMHTRTHTCKHACAHSRMHARAHFFLAHPVIQPSSCAITHAQRTHKCMHACYALSLFLSLSCTRPRIARAHILLWWVSSLLLAGTRADMPALSASLKMDNSVRVLELQCKFGGEEMGGEVGKVLTNGRTVLCTAHAHAHVCEARWIGRLAPNLYYTMGYI